MKKNTIKSTTFKVESVEGKNEIKKASVNIFFLRNELRALARKNEFCDSKSVAKVAKAVRNYTNGGCLFDLNAFTLINGEYFIKVEKKTQTCYGKETYITTQKITLTLTGLFNAFCAVAKAEIKALEDAEYAQQCAEEKAQKAHIRNVNMKLKELAKALDKGILSESEYNAKVALLG